MPSGGNSTGGNNSLLHLDSGSFIAVNLTASADSDTSLAFDQINSLGMGLIANATLWFNGQTVPLWFNGQALPLAAVLPSTDLNNDGTANFTALLPAANLSVNTTAFLTNLAQNSTLVAGYAYDPDTGNIESFLLVPMTNPFIDPATKIPVVVPVNSAFNKQAVAENGYAIPDNADENLTCVSGPNEGELMVNYPGTFPKFIPGFFGIVPGTMPASFFDGANVTIVKLAVNDTETGQEEAGQVRFHVTYDLGLEDEAQYHIPISGNDVTGNSTVNNLVPALYAASPTIPNGPGVQYWVEGVTPGPITLQYTYTKGNITISQKQQFMVCTQQSKADWQNEIDQQIMLETDGAVDMGNYTPGSETLYFGSNPFYPNKQYIQNVYKNYEEMYEKSSDLFLWSGLAKMAGGPVYGGLNDAEWARDVAANATLLADFSDTPEFIVLTYVADSVLNSVVDFTQDTLMYGNYLIYDDLAWEFRAYQASGIWALRYDNVAEADGRNDEILPIDINAWDNMYKADYTNNATKKQQANLSMTLREQEFTVQKAWDVFQYPPGIYAALNTGDLLDSILSDLAKSPLSGGASFLTVVPGGDITQFSNRWQWINASNGIWLQWIGLSAGDRASTTYVDKALQINAQNYSYFYGFSSTFFPIIW